MREKINLIKKNNVKQEAQLQNLKIVQNKEAKMLATAQAEAQ
jgi:hypothetical protein